jgi:hypothetical protein
LIGLFPTWNSIPCNSISHKEFYFWSLFLVILLSWWIGPTRTTGVYLVCVCVNLPFDLWVEFIVFFVFILFSRHKSLESMKIGPHLWGQPLSCSPGIVHPQPSWSRRLPRRRSAPGTLSRWNFDFCSNFGIRSCVGIRSHFNICSHFKICSHFEICSNLKIRSKIIFFQISIFTLKI